ncbi:MAG: MoaD/ThiS family protein, partial [Acidimicrobiales bacterium]
SQDSTRAGEAPASVVVLYFAAARLAAGTPREEVHGSTVAGVLADSRARHGESFAAVLDGSRVWVNGRPATPSTPLSAGDEVAVLPPVSGGSGTA